jgi:hypothetical protein
MGPNVCRVFAIKEGAFAQLLVGEIIAKLNADAAQARCKINELATAEAWRCDMVERKFYVLVHFRAPFVAVGATRYWLKCVWLKTSSRHLHRFAGLPGDGGGISKLLGLQTIKA